MLYVYWQKGSDKIHIEKQNKPIYISLEKVKLQ